jgi:hypothetical protein
MPVDMKLIYPEHVSFADETGCNTNQKKDGHIAGTKYVVRRGTIPKIQCATSACVENCTRLYVYDFDLRTKFCDGFVSELTQQKPFGMQLRK